MAACASASHQVNMRFLKRFLFVHTQKHTQESSLDFSPSGVQVIVLDACDVRTALA
jgi:hypothetical protein